MPASDVYLAAASACLMACATASPPELRAADAAVADLDAAVDAPRRLDAPASDARPPVDGAIVAADAAPLDAPIAACALPASGVLATWSMTTAPGGQATSAASSAAPGVTAGDLHRAAGLTASAGAGSMSASNWATSAQRDLSRYYTLSIAPPAGCRLDLSSLSVSAKASGTGPAAAAVATSADAFALTASVATAAPSTPALAVTDATGAVEVRLYGYGATSASGTLRLQTELTLSGVVH